jgi:tetratricopeptide (TPR) repeat protein
MQEQLKTIEDLLAKRDIKKAEVALAKLLRSELTAPDRASILILRARARLLSARPADAIADLQEARSLEVLDFSTPELLELHADTHFARFELASVGFADRNDATEAQNTYRQAVEQFPDYPNIGWLHYQLGRVLLTANQVEEALDCFQKALLSISHVGALTAYCYERLGFVAFYEQRNLNQAIGFLNRSADTYPVGENRAWLVPLHLLRSRVLRDMHKHEQAIQAAELALSIATQLENRQALAEALFTTAELMQDIEGREREVINLLQQFTQTSKKPLGVDVTWSRAHEMLADAYFKQGQYDSAITAYQSALQYNPYHPWEISLYYRMACSYYQQRDYENSIKAVNRIFEAAKEEGQQVSDYRVYDVLGNAQFALGKYDKAVEAYHTALEIAPPNAQNVEKIRKYYETATQRSSAL